MAAFSFLPGELRAVRTALVASVHEVTPVLAELQSRVPVREPRFLALAAANRTDAH
jgi:hypothetical protein